MSENKKLLSVAKLQECRVPCASESGHWEVSSETFPELNANPFSGALHQPGSAGFVLFGWFGVFFIVIHNKHLREMHWLGECCLLNMVQVSQRE